MLANQYLKKMGMTVIEMLMALSIGLIMLTILLQSYLQIHRMNRMVSALNDIQYQATSATNTLRSILQTTNRLSCMPVKNRIIAIGNHLFIKKIEKNNGVLLESMQELDKLIIDSDANCQAGDRLMIADCRHSELFVVASNLNKLRMVTPEAALHFKYEKGASIARYSTYEIFAEKNKLYMRHHNQKIILANNINHFSMKFTVLQAGNWLSQPEEQIDNWDDVKGVEFVFAFNSLPIQRLWFAYVPVGEDSD